MDRMIAIRSISCGPCALLPTAASNLLPWANVVGVKMTRERVPVETSFRSAPGNRAAGGTGQRTGDVVRLRLGIEVITTPRT